LSQFLECQNNKNRFPGFRDVVLFAKKQRGRHLQKHLMAFASSQQPEGTFIQTFLKTRRKWRHKVDGSFLPCRNTRFTPDVNPIYYRHKESVFDISIFGVASKCLIYKQMYPDYQRGNNVLYFRDCVVSRVCTPVGGVQNYTQHHRPPLMACPVVGAQARGGVCD